MSADSLAEIQSVPTLQDLKDIVALDRADNMIQYVRLINDTNVLLTGTLPVFTVTDALFKYDAGSLLTEELPLVCRPTDDSGAYVMVYPRIVIQTIKPQNAPQVEDARYLARLASPDRLVNWKVKDPFPAVPDVSDWIIDTTPSDITDGTFMDIATNAFPTFTPDAVGQRVRDTVTNLIFRARDLTIAPLWQLDTDDFALIPTTNSLGGNITGDFTLSLTDHMQLRELTNSANITLPSLGQDANSHDINIRVKISHFEALAGASTTVTFTPSGVTVNGGAIPVSGSNTVFEVYNQGDKWFVK